MGGGVACVGRGGGLVCGGCLGAGGLVLTRFFPSFFWGRVSLDLGAPLCSPAVCWCFRVGGCVASLVVSAAAWGRVPVLAHGTAPGGAEGWRHPADFVSLMGRGRPSALCLYCRHIRTRDFGSSSGSSVGHGRSGPVVCGVGVVVGGGGRDARRLRLSFNNCKCNTIQYNTIHHNTIQYKYKYKYNTIPYHTIPYHTMQYN